MKILKFKTLFMALIGIASIGVYVSCEEIDMKIEEENPEIGMDPPPGDTPHVDTTEIDTILYQKTAGSIPTTGITVSTEGYLSFATFTDFDNTISALVNRAQEQSDAWATNFTSFTSRYAYYEGLESDPTYNDRTNNYKRLDEEAFERLISSNDKINIEGHLIEYDFANGTYDVTDPSNVTTTYGQEHGAYKTYQYAYCSQRYNPVTQTLASGKKLESWKYCVDYGVYKAIGFKSSHFNASDQRETVYQTHLVDRWNKITWQYLINVVSVEDREFTRVKIKTNRARKNHGYTVDYLTRAVWSPTLKDFKLNCFPRIHTWTNNFNDDLHNDNYCISLPCD